VAVAGLYGNAAEYPGASAHAPDYLVGIPVMVNNAATLTHLCVIGKTGGPNVVLALYGSDLAGEPNHLVATAPATPLAVGAMEVPVPPTALAAGKYWMFGVYDADASIGLDESDPNAPVRYVVHPYASSPPEPFGLAGAYVGQRFNYYIRVQ
jgi:hypothetical protein